MPFQVSMGGYRLLCTVGDLPSLYDKYREYALVADEYDLEEEGSLCFLGVGAELIGSWPQLVIALRYDPPYRSAFYPGALIVPETGFLFFGAGTTLLGYDLHKNQRQWRDETNLGFWRWRRHGDFVVMSAELELAAWTLSGRKLWTTFVEPPWSYSVEDQELYLDVMGDRSHFPLGTGPR